MTVRTPEAHAAFLKLPRAAQEAITKVSIGIRSHAEVLEELSDHVADGARFDMKADKHPDEDAHDETHDYIARKAEEWRTAVAEVMQPHPAVAKHYRKFAPEVHAVYLGRRDYAAKHAANIRAQVKATAGALSPSESQPL